MTLKLDRIEVVTEFNHLQIREVDEQGNLLEKTPDDMHKRLAREFARIEKKFGGPELTEDQILDLLKDFNYIVPQGSPMMGIGNNQVNVSLSNCVVVESPQDNMSSIIDAGKETRIPAVIF